MIVWGVDPGVDGAIAMIQGELGVTTKALAENIPYLQDPLDFGFRAVDIGELNALLYALAAHGEPSLIVMETPQRTFHKGGKLSASGLTMASSWFNLARLFGQFERFHDCPILPVEARIWKKEVGVTSDKDECVAVAERWFSHFFYSWPLTKRKQKHEGGCEALLIAHYGLTTYGDKL